MLAAHDREQMLAIAEAAIRHGLRAGRPLVVDPADFSFALSAPGACFVTLQRSGSLRGCIGSLEARRPLIVDVAENAYAAAFRDPRFMPLTESEWSEIELEISVLTTPEPMAVQSEAQLLAELVPGRDGLVLEAPGHRATFLPIVWQSLPEPRLFLDQLRMKAGLPPGYWSETLHFARYRTEMFGRAVTTLAVE